MCCHNQTNQDPHLARHGGGGARNTSLGHIQSHLGFAACKEHRYSNLHAWCLLYIACGEPISSRGHGGWGPAELRENQAVLFFSGERGQNLFIMVIMVNKHLLIGWGAELHSQSMNTSLHRARLEGLITLKGSKKAYLCDEGLPDTDESRT